TALTTIRQDLGASMETLEWTVNAYNLSFAVLLLTGAALGDRFGRRRMFLVGLTIFTAASAACAVSPNVEWLIAARAVQGAGGAIVMPIALALLSAAFSPDARPRALGLYSGLAGLAILGGPVIGGAIVQGAAWHWIFWLNVPIGVVTIALSSSRIRSNATEAPRAALDIVGLLLAGGASLALVWGLARSNAAGWWSTEVLVALGVGLVLGVGFVGWELRSSAPMIPMRLFRSRAFSAGNAASFLFTAALYGTLFFATQFLQTAQGYTPLQVGLRLLPWTATLFFIAPLAGRLVTRFGERPLIVLGLLLQAAGFAWIRAVAAPDVDFVNLIVPFVLAGAGVSMAMPAAQNAVLSAVHHAELGKASGTYNSMRFLGGTFGIALAATVFGAVGGFGSPEQFTAGFSAAVGVSALLSCLGALVGASVPGRVRTSA
ncbi:MAG TPA: DHA2 family efflux MFS transporter permease subunit, partial [Chloroflexota bacterium]